MIYEGQSLRCEMLENGIAEVIFDSQTGSVNKFDKDTLAELKAVIEALNLKDDVRGAIVTSAKGVFIVGADITEFLGMFKESREQMIAWCEQAAPNTPIRLGAQVYLRRFYQSFGFVEISAEYLEDDIPHVDMERPA